MAIVLNAGANDRFGPLRRWWQLRSSVEQTLVVVGLTALLALLLWVGVWQPLQRENERMTRELATQRTALAIAHRQVDAMATLERGAPATSAADPRVALDAGLAAFGLKPTAVERTDDGRLRVTFDTIAFDTLARLLDTLQRDGHLRAVELTATARVETGQVRADISLAR